MKPFNRKVEKVLAWIANVILIVLTGFLAYGSFFKISVLKDNQEFLNLFKQEIAKNPNGVNLSAEQILDYTIQGLKMYSVLLIVLAVVALLATFLMKKRILSGILFLLWLYTKSGAWKNSSPGFQFLYTKRQISNIIKVYKNN